LLRTRVISAVILAPLFLGLIYLGFPYFHLLMAAIAAVMAWEFCTMDGREGAKRRIFAVLAAIAAVGTTTLFGFAAGLAVTLAATVAKVVSDQAAGRSGFYLVQAAIPYVALPAITLLFVYSSGGVDSIYWILAVVWGTDIGAYAFGRAIGGPKLAPAISPKKTWAGAVGGLICGTGAAAGVMAALNMPLTASMFGVALLASLASEAGDLLESALKRWYDVKDSGTLIPGHGGLMDRFDGLWAAAPVTALFCVIFDGGVHRW